jgi:hypothetical protein
VTLPCPSGVLRVLPCPICSFMLPERHSNTCSFFLARAAIWELGTDVIPPLLGLVRRRLRGWVIQGDHHLFVLQVYLQHLIDGLAVFGDLHQSYCEQPLL